jgi:hypothetical protein
LAIGRLQDLGVVYRYGNGQKPNSPSSENPANENHGKVLSCALKDGPNKTNEGSHENRELSSKPVHREASLERPKYCTALKVELMAPMMSESDMVWKKDVVRKKARKFFDAMTSVITPTSYPNKNDLKS